MAMESWSLWQCVISGPGASRGWAAWCGESTAWEQGLTESITTTKAGEGPQLQGAQAEESIRTTEAGEEGHWDFLHAGSSLGSSESWSQ